MARPRYAFCALVALFLIGTPAVREHGHASLPPGCWSNVYTGPLRDGVLGSAVIEEGEPPLIAPDQGILLVGGTGGSEDLNGDSRAFLFKVDSAGQLLWQREFAPAAGGGNWFSAIKRISDGVLETADPIVVAGSRYAANGKRYIWLMKLDAQGNPLWERLYDGTPHEAKVNSFQPTPDGGFILGGSGYGNEHDGFVLKVDSEGAHEWDIYFGSPDYDEIWDVRPMSDGTGYVGTGWMRKSTPVQDDAIAFNLDLNGNIRWIKAYGTPNIERGAWIENARPYVNANGETVPAGVVVAGVATHGTSWGVTDYDGWLLRLDVADGTIRSQKAYGYGGLDSGNSEGFSHVHAIHDGGGFVMSGNVSNGSRMNDGWVVKVTEELDIGDTIPDAWATIYSGPNHETLTSVHPSHTAGVPGHEYVASGHSYSWGLGSADAWVLRLPADGSLTPLVASDFRLIKAAPGVTATNASESAGPVTWTNLLFDASSVLENSPTLQFPDSFARVQQAGC